MKKNTPKFSILFILSCLILSFASCNAPVRKARKMTRVEKIEPSHFHLPALPESMEFAGEQIDLSDIDLRERLDKELHTICYYHSSTFLAFKRANRFFPIIETVLKSENVPDDFKFLAVVESTLEQGVSSTGAQGLWQFMPQTAKEFGLEVNKEVDERRNFTLSTKAAAKYLTKAKDTLGNWIAAGASYNRGIGGVRGDIRRQGVTHFFDAKMNNETARYVLRLLAVKLIFENPHDYGFFPEKMELYPAFKVKQIQINEKIDNLAEWAIEQGINYKILVKLNPWIEGNQLSKRSQGYIIELPINKKQFKQHGV